MNKYLSMLTLGGLLLLFSACALPQAAPTLIVANETAVSQNTMGTQAAEGGTLAPTLPPESTISTVSPAATDAPVTPVLELKPADADTPTAGICTDPPAGDIVTMTIRPDVPDPRCTKALPTQKLVLVNGTDAPVQAQLGLFDLTIQPGEEGSLELPMGEYLASGVHFIQVSAPGLGGELWLVDN